MVHFLHKGTKCWAGINVVIPLRYRTHSRFALKEVKEILMGK